MSNKTRTSVVRLFAKSTGAIPRTQERQGCCLCLLTDFPWIRLVVPSSREVGIGLGIAESNPHLIISPPPGATPISLEFCPCE